MSSCNPRVRFLSDVPESILIILKEELDNWEYTNPKFERSDRVFIKHSVLPFNFSKPSNMSAVGDWCRSFVGTDCKIVQAMFNAIPPMTTCPAHVDTLNFHMHSNRLHIPILNASVGNHYTFEKVNDKWEITEWNMAEGKLWQLDNVRPHAVANNGPLWRINFIIDIMPTDIYNSMTNWREVNPLQFKTLLEIDNEFLADQSVKRWCYYNLIKINQ